MKLLADCGLAREIDLADGITRYEHLFNHEHHDHMICMECGNSIEFYNPDIEAFRMPLQNSWDSRCWITSCRFTGLCKECRNRELH